MYHHVDGMSLGGGMDLGVVESKVRRAALLSTTEEGIGFVYGFCTLDGRR